MSNPWPNSEHVVPFFATGGATVFVYMGRGGWKLSCRTRAGRLWKIKAKLFLLKIERKCSRTAFYYITVPRVLGHRFTRWRQNTMEIIGGKWEPASQHILMSTLSISIAITIRLVWLRENTIMSWRRRVCDYARGLGLGNMECGLQHERCTTQT